MFHQERRRRGHACATAAVVIVLVATGCASGGADETDDDGTIVVYTGQAEDYQVNFNPYSPNAIEGPGTIFEPLFYYNLVAPDDPLPRLGTEFSWNDEGTELSITLRDDATWSDGENVTAEDVVFTLDMVVENTAMNSTGYAGEAEAVSDTEVVVTFDEPSFMQEPEILGRFWIVPEHIWSEFDDPETNVVEEPIGSGPFTLAEFQPQVFTLEANSDYWDGEPDLPAIRYLALAGNQSGADALSQGTIDWQTGPVPDIHNVEENYPGYKSITVPMNQIALFTCSNEELGCEGPQTDVNVRHAVHLAMNRTQLNTLAFEDTASEMSPGFALPERDEHLLSAEMESDIVPMEPHADTATELLEESGYTLGDDGVYERDGERLSMTVTVVSGWTDYITAVDTMTQQVEEAGIELIAEQVSWNEWSDMRGQGEYELLIDALHQGPAPDPYYLYSYFFATENTAEVGEVANPNFARYSNPDVDQALVELEQLPGDDLEARQPHYDTIQVALEQDMPYVPVLTGGTTSQYNAERFDGWPEEDDLYAFPAVWGRPDASQIFLNLAPTG